MATYYVGWDVGAWYCDKNAHSRDAIVVLDENKVIVASRRRVVRRELTKNNIHEFLKSARKPQTQFIANPSEYKYQK